MQACQGCGEGSLQMSTMQVSAVAREPKRHRGAQGVQGADCNHAKAGEHDHEGHNPWVSTNAKKSMGRKVQGRKGDSCGC